MNRVWLLGMVVLGAVFGAGGMWLANRVAPDVSQDTSDALTRAMAKNPAERFQSYDEFIMALTAARSQILIRQFAPQSGGTTRWWRR